MKLALMHKSYTNENLLPESNEKLEFLGDAVLDLVVGEYLMDIFPKDPEGALSKKRASLVNEAVLCELAINHQLDHDLMLGRGENKNGSRQNPRILASCYEAVIGAVYLDQGYEEVKKMIREDFEDQVKKISEKIDYELDYKTRFQEVIQKLKKETPQYQLISEEGPSHQKLFKVQVSLQGEVLAEGEGRSKKAAEQQAAAKALKLERWA